MDTKTKHITDRLYPTSKVHYCLSLEALYMQENIFTDDAMIGSDHVIET
jgi:hypothetical protein